MLKRLVCALVVCAVGWPAAAQAPSELDTLATSKAKSSASGQEPAAASGAGAAVPAARKKAPTAPARRQGSPHPAAGKPKPSRPDPSVQFPLPDFREAMGQLAESGRDVDLVLGARMDVVIALAGRVGRSGDRPSEVMIYEAVLARLAGAAAGPLQSVIARATINRGLALEGLGRPDDAIAAYDQVIARFSGRDDDGELRALVGRAWISKGVAIARGQPDQALDALERGMKLADPAQGADSAADQDKARATMLSVLTTQAERADRGGDARGALALYDRIIARFGTDPARPAGGGGGSVPAASPARKLADVRDYLRDCLASKPDRACSGADLDSAAQPLPASLPATTFVARGGGALLTVQGDLQRLARFSLAGAAGNDAACSLAGSVRFGAGTPDETPRVGSTGSEACRIAFGNEAGGVSVAPSPACRSRCGEMTVPAGIFVPLPPACAAGTVAATRKRFVAAYGSRKYAAAERILASLAETCRTAMYWKELYSVLNDLANTQYHLDRFAACRATLTSLAEAATVASTAPDSTAADRDVQAAVAKAARTNLRMCEEPTPGTADASNDGSAGGP